MADNTPVSPLRVGDRVKTTLGEIGIVKAISADGSRIILDSGREILVPAIDLTLLSGRDSTTDADAE